MIERIPYILNDLLSSYNMRFSRLYLFVLFALTSIVGLHAQDMTQQITKGWKLDFVMYDIPVIPTEQIPKAVMARFDSLYPKAMDVWWMQEPSDETRPEILKGYLYIASFIANGNKTTFHSDFSGKKFYYFTSQGLATVPRVLQVRFDSIYPGAMHVFWTTSGNKYVANFLMPKNSSCFNIITFDKAGNVVYAIVHHPVLVYGQLDTALLSPFIKNKFKSLLPNASHVYWADCHGIYGGNYQIDINGGDTNSSKTIEMSEDGNFVSGYVDDYESDSIRCRNFPAMQKVRSYMYKNYPGCWYSNRIYLDAQLQMDRCLIDVSNKKGKSATLKFNKEGKLKHRTAFKVHYIVVE